MFVLLGACWGLVLTSGCADRHVLANGADASIDEDVSAELASETALAADLGEATSTDRLFADLAVPHTEIMVSDYAHGCGATSNTGRSLYLELFSSDSPERFAVTGKYAHWQPHVENGLPNDNRFVAVLSDTTQFSRTNILARLGAVEVLKTDGEHITVKYSLTFEGNGEQISGSARARYCGAWEHSWLGISRLNPTESRN
ncbi:MAG TPA: hypothetical protein VJV78_30165 [Polyangiales bacterium]|nr:hypothetical protein [Polyangiales bacterium]